MKVITETKKGNISMGILFLWLTFIIILLSGFLLEKYLINLKANMTRDDIVLSNLATYKDIDFSALGDTPSVFRFNDPQMALNTFKEYLQKNMDLDSNMNGNPSSVAIGNVKVKRYIIYNITGSSAEIYDYNPEIKIFSRTVTSDINSDPIYSPCGTLILKTSIHTTLEFDIEPMLKGIVGNKRTVNISADTNITY